MKSIIFTHSWTVLCDLWTAERCYYKLTIVSIYIRWPLVLLIIKMMVKILIFLFHKYYTYDNFCMTKIKLSIKFKRMTKSYPYRYLEICPISAMITIEEDHRPLRLTGLLFLKQADLFKCLCGRYRPFDPIVLNTQTFFTHNFCLHVTVTELFLCLLFWCKRR